MKTAQKGSQHLDKYMNYFTQILQEKNTKKSRDMSAVRKPHSAFSLLFFVLFMVNFIQCKLSHYFLLFLPWDTRMLRSAIFSATSLACNYLLEV